MNSLKLYFKYISISIRSQLQYRASFIMMTLGYVLVTFIEFLGIWILFDRFGALKDWTLGEVALFYGLIHAVFAVSEGFARGFDVFSRQIVTGEFDRALLRPRTTALQVLGHDFQIMRVGRLIQALIVFGWASKSLSIVWTFPKVMLLLSAFLGGIALFTGILIIQATLCFWSIQSLEILNSFTYGGMEAAQYPMSIYSKWFRGFFIFVIPIACVNYFPIIAILGKSDILNSPLWFQWISPLAGFIFLIASLFVWRVGVRHYCSTGS